MALEANIRNREATLARTYVKKYHPEIFTKIREKAKAEYAGQAFRRTTERDVEDMLKIGVVEVPRTKTIEVPWQD
jgi:hypothetical protein